MMILLLASLKKHRLSLLCAASFFVSLPVMAQEQTVPPVVDAPLIEQTTANPAAPAPAAPATPAASMSAQKGAAQNEMLGQKIKGINPNNIPSLVFTHWEHTAIRDARRARGLVRAPTGEELQNDMNSMPEDLRVKPPPEERDISLGGIAFVDANDWTIWLNGQRITPKALPEEAMDIKVFDEYIEIKWFDKYTNQIFPIRLRAHQRFNIDTRIFLPG